ncbi:MAG: ATP synthase F1 subunit epsilon [Firmicutes bacterium]|nr:ATP synthase F1 subunit epsilon [Bacillota bacterium]
MSERRIRMSVVTPRGTLFEGLVEYLTLPSVEGIYGVLPGHAPMVVALRPGVVHYGMAGRHGIAVGSGLCEILQDRATVLAEGAYLPGQLDVAALREQHAALAARIETGGSPEEIAQARQQLQRVLALLELDKEAPEGRRSSPL